MGRRGLIVRFIVYIAGSTVLLLVPTFYWLAELVPDPSLYAVALKSWLLRAVLLLLGAVGLGAFLGALVWRIEESRHARRAGV